ncbi:MAG: inosine/guanosine kinase [Deltaproteobacteria bacterium]|nr:inosine/guanosine kinase [Deltaproteobacteria bacterium]
MRFPGNRLSKHYFPVTPKPARAPDGDDHVGHGWYIVGLDEVIVDVEVHGPAELARELGLSPGESIQLSPPQYAALVQGLEAHHLKPSYVAGGTVANTLNNYTHLSGEAAVLLGAIQSSIRPGEPAFAYVAQTAKAVDLGHLVPIDGPTGTAITFISPDGDRSFGVAPGVAGDYPAAAVPAEVVQKASVALTCLYSLANPARPIFDAALRVMALAKAADVPVAFGLGTANLVRAKRDLVWEVLAKYATIAAMNALEAEALTGERDVLLAAQKILDVVDLVIITEGPRGLTMAGYTDDSVKRQTADEVRSKSIPEYNRWEFSRLLRRRDCAQPAKVYSHAHPYMGGPQHLKSTSGAGDAALAALLHDIAANSYHRKQLPDSEKHQAPLRFLTYSSLSRNTQYGNRVAYEVLRLNSPRLEGPVGHDEE